MYFLNNKFSDSDGYYTDPNYHFKEDKYGHHLHEMAQIGKADNLKVYVYGGERDIPHFHFQNMRTKEDGCLKILSNEYYSHGGHSLILSSKERQQLVRFLKAKNKDVPSETNFQAICVAWNQANPDFRLPQKPLDIKMPDYLDMPLSSSKKRKVKENEVQEEYLSLGKGMI